MRIVKGRSLQREIAACAICREGPPMCDWHREQVMPQPTMAQMSVVHMPTMLANIEASTEAARAHYRRD